MTDPALTRSRPGVLLYGMYDLTNINKAPIVRITMMGAALGRLGPVEVISGGRIDRLTRSLRWLLSGGPRRVRAVYVESTTSTPMPQDIAFLVLMRLLGKPVGIYFRDAYQLYRDIYPRTRRRQALLDWVWRLTLPLMRRIATTRYVQSHGLAEVLRLREPVLLPPGTEPEAPDLGAGPAPVGAYVGNYGWADGFDTMVAAMTIARERVPNAGLLVVGPPMPEARRATLPSWVETRQAGRDGLPDLLRDARFCIIPRPITHYTSIVLPIKLWDYLSLGKPIVATETIASAQLLREAGAGVVTPDTPEGLAAGFLELLEDQARADELASAARRYACLPGSTWEARAGTVRATLLGEPAESGESGEARDAAPAEPGAPRAAAPSGSASDRRD